MHSTLVVTKKTAVETLSSAAVLFSINLMPAVLFLRLSVRRLSVRLPVHRLF